MNYRQLFIHVTIFFFKESEKIDSADALEEEDVKLMLDATDTSREKFSPRVQVIAASGDNIIAVANPALALSPAMLPLEHHLTD